jgi:hypothetical protein
MRRLPPTVGLAKPRPTLQVKAATARARVGSLTEMKRNNLLSGRHLKGFQPLHFTWQPYRNETHQDGTATFCKISRTASSVASVVPASPPALAISRWARTGTARAFTSSGTT